MFKIYGVILGRLSIAACLLAVSFYLYSFSPWVSSLMVSIALGWIFLFRKDFNVLWRELKKVASLFSYILAPIKAVFTRDIEADYLAARGTEDETEQVSSADNVDEDGS